MRKGTLLLALLPTMMAAGMPEMADEYQVKAAMIYNLTKFIEWEQPVPSIQVCILGQNPFGVSLQQAIAGKPGFSLKEIPDVEHTGECRVLFVSSSETKRAFPILQKLNGTGLLTVGDTAGFAERGGVVNLVLDAGRVRMEINVDAANRQHLRISSKVLSLARIVKE
jgi:uncharacterized protein DUF4154